ncbi:MAG: bifunctional riboflavin kinase/FAD synthetase [Bacteroidales bacterium]
MKVHIIQDKFKAANPVVTIGVFDGVHKGHKKLLRRLKEEAAKTGGESVIVTLWPHPRLVLGKDIKNLKLLNTLEEKELLMEQNQIDNLVIVPFNKQTSLSSACDFTESILVNYVKVHKLIIGYDHHFGKGREGEYKDLKACSEKYNFELERVEAEDVEGIKISSTKIRESLLNGQLRTANNYLGYEYFISGTVAGGHQIGNKLGFPTANIEVRNPYKLIPKDGVYAIRANIEGKNYHGMLNIGYRPTFDKYGFRKTIETHLFDFKKDIYNKKMLIHFIQRIRDERKFNNVEELVEQLKKDKKTIKQLLQRRFNG